MRMLRCADVRVESLDLEVLRCTSVKIRITHVKVDAWRVPGDHELTNAAFQTLKRGVSRVRSWISSLSDLEFRKCRYDTSGTECHTCWTLVLGTRNDTTPAECIVGYISSTCATGKHALTQLHGEACRVAENAPIAQTRSRGTETQMSKPNSERGSTAYQQYLVHRERC